MNKHFIKSFYLSGCLKQYSAIILCSAVMVGMNAHPTAVQNIFQAA